MAIGDDSGFDGSVGYQAVLAGYPLVPDDGDDTGLISSGAQEINRTRDFAAALRALIPTSRSGFRLAMGIRSGTSAPSGGDPGDLYIRILN